MRRRRTITPEWQQARHLMVTIVCMVTSGHGSPVLRCSGPAPTVMRHWDTGHSGQYSVFRQTSENQQQQHDRQGYPHPRLCPSRIVSRDSSGQIRLQCVSSVSQPVWCDPLEVSRIHCVRSDRNLPKVIMTTYLQTFRYENTDKSALYTYDVDVCFAAVLAAKLGFPWIYEYITGNNCKRV